MSTNLGTVLAIDVDPAASGGFDTAAAIVTGIYPDGSLRLRVLAESAEQDRVLHGVARDGQPFYDDKGNVRVLPGDEPAASAEPAAPSTDAQPLADAPTDAPTEPQAPTVDAQPQSAGL